MTASHNPPQFNGFKLLGSRSQPLLPEEIQQVARTRPRSGRLRGGCVEFDVIEPYLELLRRRFRCDTGLRVAIDAGNGTTGLTAPRALLALGVELHAIRTVPRPTDGRAADPQDPESMRSLARVTRAIGAELGLSWDGDGDRIGVLDEHGRRYEADWLTAVLARPLLERRSGAEILFDMKASTSAIEDVRLRGGEPVLARTGYSFFRRLMRERAISFGGETSGHIMFGPDYRDGEHAPWIDDGVSPPARLWRRSAPTVGRCRRKWRRLSQDRSRRSCDFPARMLTRPRSPTRSATGSQCVTQRRVSTVATVRECRSKLDGFTLGDRTRPRR